MVLMSIPSYDFKKAPAPICKAMGGTKQQMIWADWYGIVAVSTVNTTM